MKIKACIFDMDGTILNTLSTITYYVNKTFQNHGILPINEEECKSFVGDGARKLIERALGSRGVLDEDFCDKILAEYNPTYDASPYYLTERYDGIFELLCELRARGLRLGVISNKPHSTTIQAAKHFFPGVFDAVFGGREGVPLKPAAEAGDAILSALGVSAGEACYIGDSGVDMQFGRAIEAAYSLGALWGFRSADELLSCGADAVFNSPAQMLEFILSKL